MAEQASGGLFGFITVYAEANASRPYKRLKSAGDASSESEAPHYERVLNGVLSSVLLVSLVLMLYRLG